MVKRLRDSDWALRYDSSVDSLIDGFFVPVMEPAVRYDRSTGFFSAKILCVAARGIEHLVRNGGRMRLVVGCTLGSDEVAAIARGEALREVIERRLDWPLEAAGQDEVDALELLAWMVRCGHLDVKVAVPCGPDRKVMAGQAIFHEKVGVVQDAWGDEVAFQGSVNETVMGWLGGEGGNWESINVFASWQEGAGYAAVTRASFERLWADETPHARVVDVPTAVRERLLTHAPSEGQRPRRLELLDEAEAEGAGEAREGLGNDEVTGAHTAAEAKGVEASEPAGAGGEGEAAGAGDDDGVQRDARRARFWAAVRNAPVAEDGGKWVGVATAAVEPWPHQERAYLRMYEGWPTRLLIADEVGLGKTVQAGMLLRQAWLSGRAKRILVLAPKAVLSQWQLELREKFNLSWPIYDGNELRWLPGAVGVSEGAGRVDKVGGASWPKEDVVLASSHLVRRQARAQALLAAEPWDLVVLDEAHHARRKGAGGIGEEGPNRLLQLMKGLTLRTQGLLLLTATPMQVHPVELWDLLSLLGLPRDWSPDGFERFYRLVGQPSLGSQDFELLARMFRSAEATFGPISDEVVKRRMGSGLGAKNLLRALRDQAATPRSQLSADKRAIAVQVMREGSPVGRLVSRHTRELLRRYIAEGKLTARLARRRVEDRFIVMSEGERALYDAVEDYIASTWNNAKESEKNAVGFVMTIYRRRLASSFAALRETLAGRLRAMREGVPSFDEEDLESAIGDEGVAGAEEIDDEQARAMAKKALVREEARDIDGLLAEVRRLPLDSKAVELERVIAELRDADYGQVIVFTQFTDTLDFLRGLLSGKGLRVFCYSGRGGEVPSAGPRGTPGDQRSWQWVPRDEIKRRFARGEADVLLATDAAAEGLNFQFCGALVNYDMPWNPMRVEQRIGRIDRLGQRFEDIRIVNLHYEDTVEADVYRALAERIGLFTAVVGKLQPILSRLPTRIARATRGELGDAARLEDGRDPGTAAGRLARQRLLDDLEREIAEEDAQGLDLDAMAELDFAAVTRERAACDLGDLEAALRLDGLLPRGWRAERLHAKGEWALFRAGRAPVRVTVNRSHYEEHPTSVELWSPGSPVFPSEGIGVDGASSEAPRSVVSGLVR
ncbi:MAG: DEAD/DEAH box helicase family protein [Deltaproteobacteria bacterium]|nr:DEAD/DEAH box helicase family protein [Deltaproteobacteria bacterium]